MNRRDFVASSVLGAAMAAATGASPCAHSGEDTAVQARPGTATRKILIAGGGYGTAFIRYMAQLTGKPRPKLLSTTW